MKVIVGKLHAKEQEEGCLSSRKGILGEFVSFAQFYLFSFACSLPRLNYWWDQRRGRFGTFVFLPVFLVFPFLNSLVL